MNTIISLVPFVMAYNNYVFNIGFNKCGTSSLATALNQAGIKTLHHQFTLKQNGRQQKLRLVDFWRSNVKNNLRPFQGLDQAIYGFSDFYGEACFRELDKAYPGSKFILTIRPLDDWLSSRVRHVEGNLKNPHYRGGFLTIDIESWTRSYTNHVETTHEYFLNRKEDFLLLDIPSGEGWEKLCGFLSIPIPTSTFPWSNKSE